MSDDNESSPLDRLSDEFRATLDEALIIAIASDRNLSDPAEFIAVRDILKDLALDASAEEATGFNPSGLGDATDTPNGDAAEDHSASSTREDHSDSRSQPTVSSGTEATSLAADTAPAIPRLTLYDNDSEESKHAQLRAIFSDLKDHDVGFALKTAKGDFLLAVDRLLETQYLKSVGKEVKGIDAFFVDEADATVAKKGKGKKKNMVGGQDPSSIGTLTPPNLHESKTIKSEEDIGFLCDALHLPFEYVSEIYYKKRFSSGATILEILSRDSASGIVPQDEQSKERAKEVAKTHPNIPEHFARTLVQVAGAESNLVNEVAVTLSKYFTKHPWTQKLDISYNLKPMLGDELEGTNLNPSSKTSRSATPKTSRPASIVGATDLIEALSIADHHRQARQSALGTASQLNRTGGSSKHLYRQAAGVYTDRAREHSRSALLATSATADLLVNRTATERQIDLHGLTVQDGVRIARQRVQSWWQSLGEFRSQRAKEAGYTIVTGLGRHSVGGVSQMRRAVAAALLQDGWKLEIETGRYVVIGRR